MPRRAAARVQRCVVFAGGRKVAAGPIESVCRSLGQLPYPPDALLAFDEVTGQPITLAASNPRKGGRPRIGVRSRTVQLLPRHWEWLEQQPGGASAWLRARLDEDLATAAAADPDQHAAAAVRRFASTLSPPPEGLEQACAALAAGDLGAATEAMQAWPADVRDAALALVRRSRARRGRR